MNKNFRKSTGLLGAICGGLLIGLPATPRVAIAQQQPSISPTSQVNPCPSIFYEEPYNNRALVPQECPPNAFTQKMRAQGQYPVPSTSVSPTQEQTRMGVGGEAPTAPPTTTPPTTTPPTTTSSSLNPCPRIYYEEPHNNRFLVPQGCPPNAFTQKMQPQATTPAPEPGVQQVEPGTPGTPTAVPVQPPAPETRQQPIATVTPIDGRVNVRLKNNTNAVVAYEVIGHTGKRLLPGRNEVVLRDLPVAVTITAVRQDRGFLRFTPTKSESGLLELSLDEQTTATNNQGAIRIQENGSVFLN